MPKLHLPIAALATLGAASAQTVTNYWDFSSVNDVVGNVATTMVGAADLSQSATYGEAYPGSGASLNSVLGGTSAGGGFLEAAVFTGNPTALQFAMNSFSFSYWCWDDFAADQDVRGPRIFDCLDGTTVGIQMGTNAANDWNFRVDDDNGAVNIFNNVQAFQLPQDQWVHVVGVVDRGASEIRAYVNGALQATVPFNNDGTSDPMTGNVVPTQDLWIGVINGGANSGGSQTSGLDDLAFYDGVLSATDAMDLASGTKTPLSFAGGITRYCDPANPNSTGASGVIDATGSVVATDNDLTLSVSSLPQNAFGFFITSQTQGMINNPAGSQGVLCLAGSIGRYVAPGQIQSSGATGSFALALDLTQTPTPTGLVTVQSGETWNFQAWHRDSVGGMATSNFTDALSIAFQ